VTISRTRTGPWRGLAQTVWRWDSGSASSASDPTLQPPTAAGQLPGNCRSGQPSRATFRFRMTAYTGNLSSQISRNSGDETVLIGLRNRRSRVRISQGALVTRWYPWPLVGAQRNWERLPRVRGAARSGAHRTIRAVPTERLAEDRARRKQEFSQDSTPAISPNDSLKPTPGIGPPMRGWWCGLRAHEPHLCRAVMTTRSRPRTLPGSDGER
jgi:hypothetical protein